MKDEDKTNEQLIRELAELRQRVKELEKSEEKNRNLRYILAAVIDNLSEGIIVTDFSGSIIYVNKATEILSGYYSQELFRKSPGILNGEAGSESIQKEIVISLLSSRRWCRELLQRRKDGVTYPAELEIFPVYDEDATIIAWASIQRDTTRKNLLEEAMWESQKRYESFLKVLPVGLFQTDAEGMLVYVNERFKEIAGISTEEAAGKSTLLDFFAPSSSDITPIADKLQQCIKSRGVFKTEARFAHPNGQNVWVMLEAIPFYGQDNNLKWYVGTVTDITDRKLAEDLLQESYDKYRLLVENAPAGIYDIDFINLRLTSVNDVMCEYTGYTKEELLSINPFNLLSDESKIHFTERVRDRFLGKKTPEVTEFKIIGKNGREIWSLISAKFKYENGIPVGASVVAHNITEHKKMEELLKNNERFMANIFESIQDRLFVIDNEFNIMRVNKKVEQIYSHSMPLIGKKCYFVYHQKNEFCDGCPAVYTLKDGKPAHAVITTKDSKENILGWLEHYCYPFEDEQTGEIKGVIVYARDITEKVKAEKEIIRLDRLYLVGEMAASIGHEIRNPMTAVRGLLQFIKGKEKCPAYNEYFSVMIDELDRANSIITEFLSLARNKPVELKNQNINSIINSISPLITVNAANSNVDLECQFGDVPDLLLDEKDFRQLIHNLVKNGIDAMSHGGKLIVKTFSDGSDVVLAIQDQGRGIEPGLFDRIGTPFFTTKEYGTGLGLAVCYGIADRHNAAISFDTGPSGTTFYVRFRGAYYRK